MIHSRSLSFAEEINYFFPRQKSKGVTGGSMYDNTFSPNTIQNTSYGNNNTEDILNHDPRKLATSYMMYKVGKFWW